MDGERNQSRMESGGHNFYDTVEVHCCVVMLIREELLEQIAAGYIQVQDNYKTFRSIDLHQLYTTDEDLQIKTSTSLNDQVDQWSHLMIQSSVSPITDFVMHTILGL